MEKTAASLTREYLSVLHRAQKLVGKKVRQKITGGERVGKIQKVHVNDSKTWKVSVDVLWNDGEPSVELDLSNLQEW